MGRAWLVLFSSPRGFTSQAMVSRYDQYHFGGEINVIFKVSGRYGALTSIVCRLYIFGAKRATVLH